MGGQTDTSRQADQPNTQTQTQPHTTQPNKQTDRHGQTRTHAHTHTTMISVHIRRYMNRIWIANR